MAAFPHSSMEGVRLHPFVLGREPGRDVILVSAPSQDTEGRLVFEIIREEFPQALVIDSHHRAAEGLALPAEGRASVRDKAWAQCLEIWQYEPRRHEAEEALALLVTGAPWWPDYVAGVRRSVFAAAGTRGRPTTMACISGGPVSNVEQRAMSEIRRQTLQELRAGAVGGAAGGASFDISIEVFCDCESFFTYVHEHLGC